MDLDQPNKDEISHSQKLIAKINAKMAIKGYLYFEEYMNMALYEPNLGYYSSANVNIGKEGDFITAPEISPLFSECFANNFIEVLSELNNGVIIEFGAGRGRFAEAVLMYLNKAKMLPKKYYIIELSAQLMATQQEYLKENIPELYEKIEWLKELPKQKLSGVIFANEVLDAMPVTLFKKDNNQLYEMLVVKENSRFILQQTPLIRTEVKDEIKEIEQDIGEMPEGIISEINLWIKPWINSLSNVLASGVIFLCDYGYSRKEYYTCERENGTLQCYYRHKVHNNPLIYPGLQDITAHIDFTNVAIAAEDSGFELEGYATQALFLSASGIDKLYNNQLKNLDEMQQLQLAHKLKKLMLPSNMGENFKVLAFSKEYPLELSVFNSHNIIYKL